MLSKSEYIFCLCKYHFKQEFYSERNSAKITAPQGLSPALVRHIHGIKQVPSVKGLTPFSI
jgi:hypothetical protein